jgi:hypothetical protein
MFGLTNYRIFMDLFFSEKYKMADLFNMVVIWAKFSKSCKFFFDKSNSYFFFIFVDILVKYLKKKTLPGKKFQNGR